MVALHLVYCELILFLFLIVYPIISLRHFSNNPQSAPLIVVPHTTIGTIGRCQHCWYFSRNKNENVNLLTKGKSPVSDRIPNNEFGKQHKQYNCQNIMNHKWNTKIALIAAASIVSLQGLNAQEEEPQGPDRPGRGPHGKGAGMHLIEMDTNEDGVITQDEFLAAAAAHGDEHATDLFARYDTDEDGVITTDEVSAVHAAAIEERLLGILARWDANEDGQLTADELESAGTRGRGHRHVLNEFDADEDGTITSDELLAGGAAMLDERVNGLLEKLDTNDDGQITADEVAAAQDAKAGEQWASLLEKLDADENGEISLEEIEAGRPQREGAPEGRRRGPRPDDNRGAVDGDDNEQDNPRDRRGRPQGGPRGPRRGR